MRLRNNPRALDKLLQHEDIVLFKPQEYKGQWKTYFNNTHPIHVELGMGRGQFITNHAKKHPEFNYIGIELRNEVVANAMDKVLNLALKNIALIPSNIAFLEDMFAENEVDRFFINFCDPWPKVRHAKRRLTHRLFLEKYKKLLKKDGDIILKTDCRDLFDFSIEEFEAAGFHISDVTYDLHHLNDTSNIQTEYESKFSNMGISICRLKARHP